MMIRLTPAELLLGAQIGIHRHMAALNRGLPDKHGFNGDGWGVHVEGALGEIAAAKALGVYYTPTINTFKAGGDVGGFQVRTRSRTDYDLIVRESDDPDQRYILVVGVAPQFDVVGWIVASDARLHPEWRQSHGGREEAWFVPQLALNPIETCRHMLTH